jgi:hypothetical protein
MPEASGNEAPPPVLSGRLTMFGYLSCPECGVAVQAARLATAEHDCSAERRIAHQMLRARLGIERLEHDLARWLETPRGRFAAFLARRSAR